MTDAISFQLPLVGTGDRGTVVSDARRKPTEARLANDLRLTLKTKTELTISLAHDDEASK